MSLESNKFLTSISSDSGENPHVDNDEEDEDFDSDTLLYHMDRKYLNDPYMENSTESICWVIFYIF